MEPIAANESQADAKSSNLKLLFGVIILGLVFDQLTKIWALGNLEGSPIFIADTEIGFSLAFNSGSAFSLFQGSTIFITIAGLVILAILFRIMFKAESKYLALSYSLIISGAMGNLVDRFFQEPYWGTGNVTDFIKVGSFPTFNIADSLISIGVVCLIIFTLLDSRKVKDEPDRV